MSRTVTALYDSKDEAEAARERLSTANIMGARIVDGGPSLDQIPLPDQDRQLYRESLSRGGFMLIAEAGGQQDADRIVHLLEGSGSVDLGARQEEWKKGGWSAGAQKLPGAEEQLQVGKREVERGGARVRSYVREVPVHEEVSLREEHVSVERRPIDPPVDPSKFGSADPLREREVEMTATGEEAVVSKQAHVREEVVVRKTEAERPQTVRDTVAQMEVRAEAPASPAAQRHAPAPPATGTDQAASLRGDQQSRSNHMAQNDSFRGAGSAGTTPTSQGQSPALGARSDDLTPGTYGSGAAIGGGTWQGGSNVAQAEPLSTTAGQTQDYQRTGRELTVTERGKSRPSTAVVIGSALAGAVAGSAIPFMLASRKSERDQTLVADSSGSDDLSDRGSRRFGRRRPR